MRLTNPMATLTTTPRRLVAAFLVLLVVGVVATLTIRTASSVLSGTTANNSNTFGAADCFAPVAVAVGSGTNNIFVPATVTITAGSCIKWTQGVTRNHNSTSNTNVWVSPNPLGLGGSFEFKFATAGSYPYKCTLHPGSMTGTITVT